MYFIRKIEDKLTLKSSLNEQKNFFLTFNMKKCHVIFVVGNFFQKLMESILTSQSAECSQRNAKLVLITQILCELNTQQKSKK